MDITFGCNTCQQRKEKLASLMSEDFKKGFLVALGVIAAMLVVGWAMKLF